MKISLHINTPTEEDRVIEFTKKTLKFLSTIKIPYNIKLETYNKDKYEQFKARITKDEWKKEFEEKIETFFNYHKTITVCITNYGTYGFYWPQENKVFINMHHPGNIIRTIQHEIIHLIIEPYIDKYKIEHGKKEKIVNQLVETIQMG